MKARNQKLVSIMATAAVMFSLATGTGTSKVKAVTPGLDQKIINEQKKAAAQEVSQKDTLNWLSSKYGVKETFNDNLPVESTNPNDDVRVIVQLEDSPVLKRQGLEANIAEDGVRIQNHATKAADNALKAAQNKKKDIIKKASNLKSAKIRHEYDTAFNGFSMEVKRSEIANIKKMTGVKKVTEARVYKPDMTSAKALTQAYDTWNDLKLKGEGMVVAIIDTGIDFTHKDMRITNTSKDALNKDNVLTADDKGKFYSDKVPYGYNFADNNQEVKDLTSSMHGMHVAGIVAANGKKAQVDTNQAIQGVAPEAQLLAMKVFSNDPNNTGAYTDDLVAAIESSVEHKADVINMSLGSPAGFQDPDDPEQLAVKEAADAGVQVVISAGNNYNSTYPYKMPGVVDTAMVGSPGLAKDSLCVASYENTNITCVGFDYTGGTKPVAYFTSEIDPVGTLKGAYQLVDCGIGQTSDFAGKDLKGKIALIKRGTLDFVTKKLNAQAAGAAGVVVYNQSTAERADGGDSYVSMATDTRVKIPSIFIGNTDGVKLVSLISSGVTISFNGAVTQVANPATNDMSDFTSWGPTPNLDFKPQISAPGGNIYSTVNNNKYETMSGTSMASPHTAGSEALIMQGLKKVNPELAGTRMIVDLAKISAMNTAKVEMDKNNTKVPFSPRRQGAGLVQIENAIKNKVTVTTDDFEAAAALKEIGKTKSFNLQLRNLGNKAVTYTLDNMGGAYTEYSDFLSKMSYDVAIEGATVTFDKSTVKVPANGAASVKVTINLPDNFATEQFVEGYVKFVSKDASVPSLSVPYMGFYGSWSKPDTIDKPIWDSNSNFGITTQLTNMLGGYYYLGYQGKDKYGNPIIDPNQIAISPNNDGYYDNVIPKLYLLRNIKNMNIDVLDSNNKVIRTISQDELIRKDNYTSENSKGAFGRMDNAWMWDGTVFNSKTGNNDKVKDGQYSIRVTSKIDFSGAKPQTLTMPVKVDTVGPDVQLTSSDKSDSSAYTLKWTENDALSGVDPANPWVFLNGQRVDDSKIKKDSNGVFSCDVTLAAGENRIAISALDNAMNETDKEFSVNLPLNMTFNNFESGMQVNKPDFTVSGKINAAVASLTVNGTAATINPDLTFSAAVKLNEGMNAVSVVVKDFQGNTLADYAKKVVCDSVGPVIVLDNKLGDDGKLHVTKKAVTLTGKVTDNTFGCRFYINGNQVLNLTSALGTGVEKTFSYNLNVTNNSWIELKAVDTSGNTTIQKIQVVIDKATANAAAPTDNAVEQ
ncbi:S8 family serine peptidase [Clostridium sp. YIM B02515]|uniref:S8 family serine peptidase n=1 Tax=Clostridium rhizosphaerae TaxID=2803861 RepID=A0ABS1T7Z1_9CLOT|nr:S8 family serine peptidase [Clostridium rhizosphaerae]MBL4935450.1 S8 family serine peptidase [Clostridium rhizosphaerae]